MNTERKILSVSMKEGLFGAVKEAARQKDLPVTVWIRELIKRELEENTGG